MLCAVRIYPVSGVEERPSEEDFHRDPASFLLLLLEVWGQTRQDSHWCQSR